MNRGLLAILVLPVLIAGCTTAAPHPSDPVPSGSPIAGKPSGFPEDLEDGTCYEDLGNIEEFGHDGAEVAWPDDLPQGIDQQPSCWGIGISDPSVFIATWYLDDPAARDAIVDEVHSQLAANGYAETPEDEGTDTWAPADRLRRVVITQDDVYLELTAYPDT